MEQGSKARAQLIAEVFRSCPGGIDGAVTRRTLEGLTHQELEHILPDTMVALKGRNRSEIENIIESLPDSFRGDAASAWLGSEKLGVLATVAEVWKDHGGESWQMTAIKNTLPDAVKKAVTLDSNGALESLDMLPEGDLKNNALCLYSSEIAKIDPLQASEVLKTQPASPYKDQGILKLIAELEGDVDSSLHWVRVIENTSLRNEALGVVLHKAAEAGQPISNSDLKSFDLNYASPKQDGE